MTVVRAYKTMYCWSVQTQSGSNNGMLYLYCTEKHGTPSKQNKISGSYWSIVSFFLAFLTTQMMKYNGDLWIGMNDVNWEMHFVWTDGKGILYTNWAKGHPTSVPDRRYSFGMTDEVFSNSISKSVSICTFNLTMWRSCACRLVAKISEISTNYT